MLSHNLQEIRHRNEKIYSQLSKVKDTSARKLTSTGNLLRKVNFFWLWEFLLWKIVIQYQMIKNKSNSFVLKNNKEYN